MNKALFSGLILIALFAIKAANAQAPKGMGLIFDDAQYEASPRLAVGGKAALTAPQMSLKEYTPYPGSQGECGSCVCWASTYAALTTSWAYKSGIKDKKEITNNAKSPMFVFIQITNSCKTGSRINDALKILKDQGSCSIYDFNPPSYEGENRIAEIEPFKPQALPYRIKDYAAVFPVGGDSSTKVEQTKLSIANHQPVIVGFQLYSSFADLDKTHSLWEPNLATETKFGGHAMTVVGYNDYQKTFEVMNSWGFNWGNDGFFTISYKDFAKLAKYGYQITMDEKPAKDSTVSVNGDFVFQKFTTWDKEADKPVFEEVSPKLENNEYSLGGADYAAGDYYRLFAKNVTANCYIYVFSIDPNNKAEVLYPFSKSAFSADRNLTGNITEVPRQYASSVVEIPGNNKFLKTDVPGVDNMCILYAYNQIDDIAGVVNKIKDSSKPTLMDKLKDVLGTRLMAESNLTYQPGKMSVSGVSKKGDIIPIVLKMYVKQ